MTDQINIIYRDAQLLVLDKPSGLLSVPGRRPEHWDSLILRAQTAFPSALTVHRLDCETSGVTVIALDKASQSELSHLFRERQVSKRYVAVCANTCAEEQGLMNLPIAPDYPNRPRRKIDMQHGKQALTHWRVLSRGDKQTRFELTPITGRTHQLRLHLKAMGHPILGDTLYAPEDVLKRAERLLLHAASLSFPHPVSGTEVTFHAENPF